MDENNSEKTAKQVLSGREVEFLFAEVTDGPNIHFGQQRRFSTFIKEQPIDELIKYIKSAKNPNVSRAIYFYRNDLNEEVLRLLFESKNLACFAPENSWFLRISFEEFAKDYFDSIPRMTRATAKDSNKGKALCRREVHMLLAKFSHEGEGIIEMPDWLGRMDTKDLCDFVLNQATEIQANEVYCLRHDLDDEVLEALYSSRKVGISEEFKTVEDFKKDYHLSLDYGDPMITIFTREDGSTFKNVKLRINFDSPTSRLTNCYQGK